MEPKLNKITAIILAGGKSSRMGKDKGFVELFGKPMIVHTINNIKQVTPKIMVVANEEKYNSLGVNVYSDVYTNKGPLGGIHTGLCHSKTEWNWVIGCDMPNINPNILGYLLQHIGNSRVVVPLWKGGAEPLCAIYNRSCRTDIEKYLLKGKLKTIMALNALNANFINITEDLDFYSPYLFTNLNTQQEVTSFISNNREG